MEIVSLAFLAIIAFLPILIWGYIFSYLDNSQLNTKRFLIGVLAGGISVIPVLYLEDILRLLSLSSFNIFSVIAHSGGIFTILSSYAVAIGAIGIVIYIISFGIFFESSRDNFRLFLKNLALILVLGAVYSVFHEFIFSMGLFDTPIKDGGVTLGETSFNTVKLIIFYYLIIGIVEESSKHFSMVTSSASSIDSVKKGVLLSVFIALGFGFIENILYLKNLSTHTWLMDSSVFSTLIFRSIFSLLVHILCSITVALYFSRAVLSKEPYNRVFAYMKLFLTGFLLSIVIHAVFDISLTLGFTGIIFVYFFFGYLSITKIFYRE